MDTGEPARGDQVNVEKKMTKASLAKLAKDAKKSRPFRVKVKTERFPLRPLRENFLTFLFLI
jgi:hypothetical protein